MDTAADEDPPKNEGKSEEVPNTSDFEQGSSKETYSKSEDCYELASATNPNVVTCSTNMEINSEEERREIEKPVEAVVPNRDNNSIEILVVNETLHKLDNVSDSVVKSEENGIEKDLDSVKENIGLKSTNFVRPDLVIMRKLSLDQSILSRSEGLSQSEINLSYIGKKPLERKPSFFRKKMDTFLRNTTEMFKKRTSQIQSSSKTGSLQCLNENQLSANSDENFGPESLSREDRNRNSLAVKAPIARSVSSLSVCQSGRYSRRNEQNLSGGGSQPVLNALGASTEKLEDNDLSSVHSLNESFLREHMLKSRAISMNSGLNSPTAQQRKRASRSNRVTWVASEGVTDYFRRLQDLSEKKAEMQTCQSYQDFSRVPENDSYKKKVDSKGRRLSYQRAVSGEDPVLPSRFQESMRTRNPIPENNEAHFELSNQLADFSANGIPQLQGYEMSPASDEVFAYIMWAETPTYIDDIFDWKDLTPEEEARQSVIKELINTEADYIRHLMSVVEVFIAAAHSLQDSGKMLKVETERLFSNLPDVLNASLTFWQTAFLPMIKDSVTQAKPFNTELMAPGFCRFREILSPYDRYVKEQSKTVEYLRSISADPEFTMYLNWCHSHKLCKRLQLADFLVKPMQRLTKYSLILRRIITHTDTEPERTSLLAMETFSKNYVLDLNRSVRQREELEKLEEVANSIDSYEVDFKDEDLDRYFRMFSQLNLRSPMVGCVGSQSRCVVFQGDMRFKDNVKEIEVHVFLLTDMLLVCKKMTKGNYPYKLIRPKYMIDRMIQFPKYVSKTNKDLSGLAYVVVDDVGSSYTSFVLSETAKDPNPLQTLRTWELKVREAKMSYDLSVWFARNPHRDLSEMELDSSDYSIFSRGTPDSSAEIEARECVAVMLHRSIGTSTEYDITQSITTDSFEGGSGRPGRAAGLRHLIHRTSTASSRNSRLSSFQQSTSAASHDEPHAGPSRLYKPGISCEHTMLPPHGITNITSITVNVVSESESDTAVSTQQEVSQASKSPDKSSESQKTLQVQTQNNVATLVHSLPDLTIEPSTPRSTSSPTVPSASEKLYQSHQELLQRNRLVVAQQHQYLTPDHRGSSYPPPSPTRASLKRGLAFSYSFKNPPLTKMGHVNSQSQVQVETASTSSSHGKIDISPSPKAGSEKSEKKTKLMSSRNKDADDDEQSGPSRGEDSRE